MFRPAKRVSSSNGGERPAMLEGLEGRTLLSASIGHAALGAVRPALSGAQVAPVADAGKLCASVVSVDVIANTITVALPGKGGATTNATFNVGTATITIDGNAGTLSQLGTLAAGAKVRLTPSATDPTTLTAIKAVGAEAEGQVTGVDAALGTVTLTDRKGVATTYALGSAPITLNGKAATLADITVGLKGELHLSALDGSVLNGEFEAKIDKGQKRREPISASVVSVDTAANTITVAIPGKGGVTTNKTFNVGTATITIDGNAGTLAQLGTLAAGAKVRLTTSATDPTTLTDIKAIGAEAEGKVTAVDTVNNTVTIVNRKGVATTYALGTAPIFVKGVTTGTIADITVGAKAELRLSALDGSVLSVRVCRR